MRNAGFDVSRLSLGTWSMSGSKNWGPNDEKDSIETIRLAMDLGINFLDTAAKYGDGAAEVILGKAVKGRRDKAIIGTKVHTLLLGYDSVLKECEDSLRRLDTDYIDLYQIHWPSKVIPFEETLRAYEKLKADGKIRAIGASNFGVKSIAASAGHDLVANQLPYSLIWRQVEDAIIPDSLAHGMMIWPYCPLAQGLLTGKFKRVEDVPLPRRETRFYSGEWKQGLHDDTGFEKEIFGFLPRLQDIADQSGFGMATLALAFLKGRKGVGSVLVGARNAQQLRDNIKMFEADVPPEVMAEVTALSDELKPRMGTNPDLWQNVDGGRFF
jgi:aryl-alcohol dehydrogenase-like predicted oxidoreductase